MIETRRLTMQPWSEVDLADVARLNADPEVMRFFPSPLTREESDAAVVRWHERLVRTGVGMLCAREKATGAFVGIIGAQWVPYEADFAPAVEIGWRLSPSFWGRSLATEGARAAAEHAFATAGVERVVAVALPANGPSIAVMRRLGMRDAGFFEHPLLPPGPPHNPHVLHVLEQAAGLPGTLLQGAG